MSVGMMRRAVGKMATKNRLVGSFEIKAKDETKRTFAGTLSTSHLDEGNGWKRDIVWPGAFKRTMDHFNSAADPYIPLLDTHSPHSIFNVFGHMLSGEERLTGKNLEYELNDGSKLAVPEMYFDTEWQVIDGVDGDRLFDRMRPGSVRKMSMGYEPIRVEEITLKVGPGRLLKEVGLAEGSLVVFAMNTMADIHRDTVKSLLDPFRDADLTDEQVVELKELYQEIGALLKPINSDEELAPDNPKRAAVEEQIRALTIRTFGTAV